jgi:hypothetical protein
VRKWEQQPNDLISQEDQIEEKLDKEYLFLDGGENKGGIK